MPESFVMVRDPKVKREAMNESGLAPATGSSIPPGRAIASGM